MHSFTANFEPEHAARRSAMWLFLAAMRRKGCNGSGPHESRYKVRTGYCGRNVVSGLRLPCAMV